MSRPLKYGQVTGPQAIVEMPIGASEVFKNLSGHFVKMDDAGRIEIAGATDVDIVGWALQGERTASSTEGANKAGVNVALDAIYEMPACGAAGAALTEANLQAAVGETVDIQMVSTNYQYADLSASAVDILLVLGYRYYGSAAGQQSVLVKLNVNKLVYTTH